jgi:hypothetical protein
VFEQVGEAALAGFDLVARSGLHDDEERNDVGVVGGNRDQAQAVGKIVLIVGIS